MKTREEKIKEIKEAVPSLKVKFHDSPIEYDIVFAKEEPLVRLYPSVAGLNGSYCLEWGSAAILSSLSDPCCYGDPKLLAI